MQMTIDNNSWEQKTISKMLEMTVAEMRARRRWGIFFKLVFMGFFLLIIGSVFYQSNMSTSVASRKGITAVVYINGEISSDKDASADNIIPLLRKAFENSSAKAVMLRINSPGGAPVQTNQINTEISFLKAKYPKKKVYAVIEDSGTSAAYMLACAADEIYADEASIVGSIGVLLDSFGFVDTLKKVGVERRLYTSGSNKAMLDPFSPIKPAQVAMLQRELDALHAMFIDYVKVSRGSKLVITDDTFSGRFWIGIEAKKVGLIDGFGTPNTVARNIIGAPEMVEYEVKQSILSKLSSSFAGSMRDMLIGAHIL
jgi:protease-4